MGLLVDGKWHDSWYETGKSGKFQRSQSQFRNWITPDGSPGPSGKGGFSAEGNRYHLYISYACPWAHRTLIYRSLKGLEDMIPVSAVHWFMAENGWTFERDQTGIVADKLLGLDFAYQIYQKADPEYSGRVTVPILWDSKTETIVSNESAEIIRMFNSAFDDVGAKVGDYYPEELRPQIDEINSRVYDTINNGVYKCGFATTQSAYDEAAGPLFDTLDFLEQRLENSRFLISGVPTEADWRLFPTLYRFDMVYATHFKCNRKRIVDYPNLWAYTRDLYQWQGISGTVNMDHVVRHYYQSHETVNPHRIVPINPVLDFDQPHDREKIG